MRTFASYGNYTCPKCNRNFNKSQSFNAHKSHCISIKRIYKSWNTGLTKETNEIVKNITEKVVLHNKIYGSPRIGTHLSEESKLKVSIGMKKAHAEGRAHNIGQSRWNNTPSYPESFFMKVIENEFEDKNYEYEYPQGIYSIDFAWVDKMKAIEIDGDQHQRFEEYRERDKRKDEFLKSLGWEILRIPWKEMHNNTKPTIQITKDFIN